MNEKEKQEISLIGRIFSMEALLLLMGLFSLGSGIYNSAPMQIFWGVTIACGAVLLHFVRKKDWQKHWAEQEEMKLRYEERRRQAREKKDGK